MFLGKTCHYHKASVSTRVYYFMGASKFNAVGYPVMNYCSIPSGEGREGEGLKYSQSLHFTEIGISSSLVGHLACMQTFIS